MIKLFPGQKFGMLTLIRVIPERTKDHHVMGAWRCECGNQSNVALARVKSGYTKSCGCLITQAVRAANTRHGYKHTLEYGIWSGMLARCRTLTNKDFRRYGARGITVCERWVKFENFIADMGRRPQLGMSIDRIDGTKGYSPDNCRWATPQEQGRNKLRGLLTIKGPLGTLPLVDYADLLGITRGALYLRMSRNKMPGCKLCLS